MNDSIENAGQAGFDNIYHYQDFHPELELDQQRIADILQRHRIFCSDPRSFNDPWDCKPYFDPDLLDDLEYRSAAAEFFIANQDGGPKNNQMDRALRENLPFLKQVMSSFSEMMSGVSGTPDSFVAGKWGLYCLTPRPCSTLMWSHYARNHKGICLEFAVANTKFVVAQRVRYQKEYPPLLLHEDESAKRMLLIKSNVWKYEREFRLICPRFTEVPNHPLLMRDNYLSIGPTDLKSIILGCQATAESMEAIRKLVTQHTPHVRLLQAKRTPNKYRLTIGRVGT